MKEEITIFKKKNLGKVRIAGDYENPLFSLNDICKCLGLADINQSRRSILQEFEEVTLNVTHFKTKGGIQKLVMITEPQLYFLIMRSDKPKAKMFRQWVINEVLPAIRKQGKYELQHNQALENQAAKYSIPKLSKYKQEIIKTITNMEEKFECNCNELIEYEIIESFKDNHFEVIKKVQINTLNLKDNNEKTI